MAAPPNLDLLDRPVWHTLRTRHAQFARGSKNARIFRPDISPFAAPADDSPENLQALTGLIPEGGSVVIFRRHDIAIPGNTTVLDRGKGVQMVAKTSEFDPGDSSDIIALGSEYAEDMLALAGLTQPGPYEINTRLLGQFWGIVVDGRLAAMTGERMKLPGLTEVSGVCTHPDFRRRGYARRLSAHVARIIVERGETPFLHAFIDNHAAIGLYQSLGFETRCEVNLARIARA